MKNKKYLILIVIALILILIPLLFWGKLFVVGGDDSRIYYVFPWEFIKNFSLKITPDNTLGAIVGYYPKSFWAPIIFSIFILKYIPFLNIQMLMFGINLAFGFLFFYLFLGLWIKSDKNYNFLAKIVSSIFYIFSTYLIKTLYVNELISIYLISIMPVVIYLFIKGIRENKLIWIMLSVTIYSIFSATFTTFSWSIALIISILPVFVLTFVKNKRAFIYYSVIFVIFFMMLNAYWMTHHIYSYFYPDGSASFSSFYSSGEFKSSNHFLISQVHSIFGPLNRVLNERDTLLLKNYSIFTLFKVIFLFTIVLAGVAQNKAKRQLREYYFLSLSCLLLSFFLFQPNFGNWSLNIFLFLNDNVPFFSMFRNMSDKFSLAMAFSYAFSLCISLAIIGERAAYRRYFVILISIIVIVIVFNAYTFIFPKYNDNNFSIRISGELNSDFNNLVNYLGNSTNSASKAMWLPLNYPSYIYIEDKNYKNHYYFGPSILSIFINKSDYAGYLSFGTVFNPDMGKKMFKDIEEKKYLEFGNTLKKLNVRYIIDNKQTLSQEAQAFLYSPKMLESQNQTFKDALFGKKIKDFGTRYSLYEIKDDYKGEKIYTNTKGVNIKYYKINDVNYNISIRNLTHKADLVFQELYNNGWVLYLTKDDKQILSNIKGISYDNKMAIIWNLDEEQLKITFNRKFYKINDDGSMDINLKLYYFPQRAIYVGQIISIISFAIFLIYQISYFFIKKLNEK